MRNQMLTNETQLDPINIELLTLLAKGLSNAAIAKKTSIPLSTVQRRTKRLVQAGWIGQRNEINYRKLGFTEGFLHVYLVNGNTEPIVDKLRNLDSIRTVSVHLGNSDIVCQYICKGAGRLLQLIADVKGVQGVDRVVWSEQVYSMDGHKPIAII